MSLVEAATYVTEDAHVAPHDPAADAATCAALAQWCERFSPVVGWDAQDSSDSVWAPGGSSDLLVDATGLAVHFGGEQAMVRQIAQAWEERGYCVRVALADTWGAAWALAHYAARAAQPLVPRGAPTPTWGSTFLVVPSCETWAAVESLPVQALRLPCDTVALLEQLGLARIGQLAHLPRSSLASRFGPLLLQRWDQLFDASTESVAAYHAPPAFQADLVLEHPTHRHAVLVTVLEQLIGQVAQALAARGEGVLELICRFRCTRSVVQVDPATRESPEQPVPGDTISLRVGLFQPTTAAPHLVQLVQMQLEPRTLPGPVEQIVVEAALTAPSACRQRELFPDGGRLARWPLAQLIDRLSSRLGAAAVVRPQWEADAQPERAYCYLPLTGRSRAGRSGRSSLARRLRQQRLARPLHLRSPPLAVPVVAVVPDGPPIQIHWQQCAHRVTRYWGPERIETGWWRGRCVRRDYYRVETDRGYWFWIFRQLEDGQWFVHGLFG